MRTRLILLIGAYRIRAEGLEAAEQAHPFWDLICRKLAS